MVLKDPYVCEGPSSMSELAPPCSIFPACHSLFLQLLQAASLIHGLMWDSGSLVPNSSFPPRIIRGMGLFSLLAHRGLHSPGVM